MSYQVLARKYRPKSFDTLVGQEHVVRALTHALEQQRLHLRRIWREADGPPILLVHGVMADGRIFYSDSGKGLAHFLADAGYDVFVADLRGRGRSTPKIDASSRHGLTEIICQDLPALHAAIHQLKGGQRLHWMAHSWGGVHMSSCLLRYPQLAAQVASHSRDEINQGLIASSMSQGVIDVFEVIEVHGQ